MPITKWGGSENPTNINFYKYFEYAFEIADRPKPTAVFHINTSRQKYYLTTSVLGDSYGPPAETHAKWKK